MSTKRSLLIALAFLSFISLGLPDAVLGVAWPSMREAFDIRQSGMALILLFGSLGYLVSSFFAGSLMHRYGVGVVLASSSAVVALSLLGYAVAPVWLVLLGAAVGWGLGSGAVDAGVNAYAAANFSPRVMNWLHASYTIGSMMGPVVMVVVLASDSSWRTGYAIICTLLAAMALLFAGTRRLWTADDHVDLHRTADRASIWESLRVSTVQMQMALFCLYTGMEVVAGQWTFTLLTEARSYALEPAGTLVTLYWGSLAAGRVVFGFIIGHVGPLRMIRYATAGLLTGALLYVVSGVLELSALPALVLLGAALAPVYPCLMTVTPARLGARHAANAVGFQASAGMLGMVLFPGIAGLLAERSTLEVIPWLLVILAFAFLGLHERLLTRTPPTLTGERRVWR